MATSYTPQLHLAKPLVNGAETENTWGFDINANFDKLDAAHLEPEDLTDFIEDAVADVLEAGDNITLEYKDAANKVRISATGEIVISDPGAGQTFFVTRAASQLATIGPEIKTFHTGAFSVHGDKGGGEYGRLSAAPYPFWSALDWKVHQICQNAGLYYRLTKHPVTSAAVTNTVPPTHSGYTEVIGADEFGWTRIAEQPQWVRTADRHTKEGATDPDHGGWWELQLKGGEVFIEQLGGVADYPGWVYSGLVPTGGTDNYDALMSAINWVQIDPAYNTAANSSPSIRFGSGRYKFTKTVVVTNIIAIRGVYVGIEGFGYGSSTQLWFLNTTGSAFCFLSNNTGPGEDGHTLPVGNNTGGSQGSLLEGLSIHGTWDFETPAHFQDYSAAVRGRATIKCIQVGIHAWHSHGFHIHGSVGAGPAYPMNGNANEWRMIDCYVHSCGGIGYWIGGMDANAGYATNPITHDCRGCGIYDGSGLGNTWIQPQISGYGNIGVTRHEKLYQYSGSGDPRTKDPATNPTEWYHIMDWPLAVYGAPNGRFPEWVSGTEDYALPKMAIFIFPVYSVLVGPYVEVIGNTTLSHTNSRFVFGGTAGYTDTSAVAQKGFESTVNFTYKQSSVEYSVNGPSTSITFGGPHHNNKYGVGGGMNFMRFFREKDSGVPWVWGYQGNDIVFNSEHGNIWEITTNSSTQVFGGNAPYPGVFILGEIALKSTVAPFTSRRIRIREGPPDGVAYRGEYTKGEWFFNAETATGSGAYVCTASGAKEDLAWASGGATGSGDIVKTDEGKIYRDKAYGVSTNKPTHTSGSVTYPDGKTWAYLGNSAPTFAACAVIDPPADDVSYVRRNGAWLEAERPDLGPLEAKISELQARIEALEAV